MIHRLMAGVVIAMLVVACGGGGSAATPPPGGGATVPPGGGPTLPPAGATTAPGVATPGSGGNPGDNASLAQALVPPGATELSRVSFGNAIQLVVSSNMSLQDLAAFYAQQIPAVGMSESGRFDTQGTLTIALVNPDGGILIQPGNDAGQYLITISVGTS